MTIQFGKYRVEQHEDRWILLRQRETDKKQVWYECLGSFLYRGEAVGAAIDLSVSGKG